MALSSNYNKYCTFKSTNMPNIYIIEEPNKCAILQYETCNNKWGDYSVRGSGNRKTTFQHTFVDPGYLA